MFVYWVLIMTSWDACGAVATVELPTREACIAVGNAALSHRFVSKTTCTRVVVPASQKQFLEMRK